MINRVVIMGRLVRDPELRTTPNGGIPVTTFTVAVDRQFQKDRENRQADFFDVVAWRNSAEFVTKYFRKGDMIALDGTLQQRKWVDKEGNNRSGVEIVSDNISFCGNRRENEAARASASTGGGYQRSDSDAPPERRRPAYGYGEGSYDNGAPAAPSYSTDSYHQVPPDVSKPFELDDDDGDLPF